MGLWKRWGCDEGYAQDNLKELEAAINALSHSGKMKPAILAEYMAILF